MGGHDSVTLCANMEDMEPPIHTRLKDGRPILLRPIEHRDESRLREGIARLSDRSRYLRFFTGARHLPDTVVKKLVDVDGVHHLAWGAMDLSGDAPKAIGAAHAMREDEGPEAEIAFAILDDYHGEGLARMLIAAIVADSASAGIETLRAEVLAENTNARRLLRHLGAHHDLSEGPVSVYRMDVAEAERRLRGLDRPPGLKDVFAAIDDHRKRAA